MQLVDYFIRLILIIKKKILLKKCHLSGGKVSMIIHFYITTVNSRLQLINTTVFTINKRECFLMFMVFTTKHMDKNVKIS